MRTFITFILLTMSASCARSFINLQKSGSRVTFTERKEKKMVSRSTSRIESLPPLNSFSRALSLRGGSGAAAAAFNLANENQKLAAIAGYSVVSTLTLNCCLRLFSSTQLQSKTSKEENIAGLIFSTLCSLTIACGAFTSICFTLLTLYSKTALGMGVPGQAKYLAFQEATKMYRIQGFHTFLISIYSFLASFVLSLYIKLKGKPRYYLTSVIGSIMFFHFFRVKAIIGIASNLIYS